MDNEAFQVNRMVQDTVIRQFEIVNKATKNLTVSFRERHPLLPRKDLAGFRDKLDTLLFRSESIDSLAFGCRRRAGVAV
jgi:uncharacterized protein with HEPN domain